MRIETTCHNMSLRQPKFFHFVMKDRQGYVNREEIADTICLSMCSSSGSPSSRENDVQRLLRIVSLLSLFQD